MVKLAPLIPERVPTSPYLVRDRASRGRASTRASLDPPPPVSAGTSPSAAPGRRGVDRPGRARVPVRPRSSTSLPGHARPVPLAGLVPFSDQGLPSNCAYTLIRWVCLCYKNRTHFDDISFSLPINFYDSCT